MNTFMMHTLYKMGAIAIYVLAAFGSSAILIEAVGEEVEIKNSSQGIYARGNLYQITSRHILPPGEGIIEYAPPGEEKQPIKQRNSKTNQMDPREKKPIREPQPDTAMPKVTPTATPSEMQSFAVYALSRGRGVPEGARDVLTKFRKLMEKMEKDGEVIRSTEQRIGLEGETKICAEFTSPVVAEKVWSEIHRIAGDQELVSIRSERCRKN